MVTAAAGAEAAFLVVDGCGRKIHVVAAGSSVAGHVLDACASPQMHGILKRRSGAGGGASSSGFCISVILLEGLLCRLLLVWVFVCFLGEKVREAHRSEKKKGGNFSCG